MYVYQDVSQNRFLVRVKIDSGSPILRNRLFDSIWHMWYLDNFFSEIWPQQIRDTCSWKGQLEKTRSWKVRHEIGKNEVGKFGLKSESWGWSWKVLFLRTWLNLKKAENGRSSIKLVSWKRTTQNTGSTRSKNSLWTVQKALNGQSKKLKVDSLRD